MFCSCVDERRGERDGAGVLHFAVFYLYRRHTTAQGNKDPERDQGNGVNVCVCVCMQ